MVKVDGTTQPDLPAIPVRPIVKTNPLPPHPPLSDYYRSRAEQPAFVRSLFNQTAADYDSANTVLSLGTGRRHRRHALQAAGLRTGMRVLDIATGTGLTAREALALTGPRGSVVGVDVSEAMLQQARRIPGMHCVQARAETLPLADGSFDFLSMGYALRHVPDLRAYFAECLRVLQPGGTLLLLEIVRPSSHWGMALAGGYMRFVVPALCRLRGHRATKALLDYYWATIEACVPADTILRTLSESGFIGAACETTAGMFNSYIARKAP